MNIFSSIFIRIYFYFEIVVVSILLTFKSFLWIFLPRKTKSLKNQVALITGSGNGLGRELALKLAKEGCHIAVVDVDFKGAEETVSLANIFNVKAKAYKIDVSSVQEIEKLKVRIENELGPVDILINNAAIVDCVKPISSNPNDIERILKVNILHHFWTTQTFLKGMIERKKGHIVGICSIMSFVPIISGSFSYSTGKGANYGFMNCLTAFLVKNKHDFIQTTSIYPYVMATRADFIQEARKFRSSELFPLVRPTQAASDIVDGIKTNQRKVFVPSYFSYLCSIFFLANTYSQDYVLKKITQMY